jgi:hypothetical protein
VGFNKKNINLKLTLETLESKGLKELYGNADAITFEDVDSSNIHQLFLEGKTDEQIISIINEKNYYIRNLSI